MTVLKGIRPHLGTIEKTMGGFLVLTGIAFLSGAMPRMSEWIFEPFPGLVGDRLISRSENRGD